MLCACRRFPVTLVVGPEQLLVDRAVAGLLAQARSLDPSVERRDVDASAEEAAGALAEALSPTLFSDAAVVVVRSADQCDDRDRQGAGRRRRRSAGRRPAGRAAPRGSQGQATAAGPAQEAGRQAGDTRGGLPADAQGPARRLEFLTREVAGLGRRATREAADDAPDAVGARPAGCWPRRRPAGRGRRGRPDRRRCRVVLLRGGRGGDRLPDLRRGLAAAYRRTRCAACAGRSTPATARAIGPATVGALRLRPAVDGAPRGRPAGSAG